MAIDQAIFTSAKTAKADGYQIVAQSEGVDSEESRDIATWSPGHDSLAASELGAISINFHPLRSGRWCVSRTIAAGEEYSRRGGFQIYTHCLLVDEECLARFANNPFRIVEAAMAAGHFEVGSRQDSRLKAIDLPGRSSPLDRLLVAAISAKIGSAALAALVDTACTCNSLGVVSEVSGRQIVAGLLNLLPPRQRRDFPFTTGLKHSPRRPFRVLSLPGDDAAARQAQRLSGMTLLDLREPIDEPLSFQTAWAKSVHDLTQRRAWMELARQLTAECDLVAQSL